MNRRGFFGRLAGAVAAIVGLPLAAHAETDFVMDFIRLPQSSGNWWSGCCRYIGSNGVEFVPGFKFPGIVYRTFRIDEHGQRVLEKTERIADAVTYG